MYRLLNLTLLLFWALNLIAQENTFVLVDVSGSGPLMNIRNEGKAIIKDLIEGKFDSLKYSNWKWQYPEQEIEAILQGKKTPLLSKGGYFVIMPFGEYNTYRSFRIKRIDNYPSDYLNAFESRYPTIFRDALTHAELARAMTASIAKEVGFNNYYMIEVSDWLTDTDSQLPNFTPKEKDAMAEFGSSRASTERIGTLRYNVHPDKNYQIVVTKINIANTNPPAFGIDSTNVEKAILNLIRPSGSKRKPTVLEDNNLRVTWNCIGCGDSPRFTVKVRSLSDKKKSKRKSTTGRSISFLDLTGGTYRVTVSFNGGSKTRYVKIKSGGSILPILLLFGVLGGGYYVWDNYLRGQTNNPNPHDGSDFNDFN